MSEVAQGETQVENGVPRRQALCGIIALGVLGPTALAACSNDKQYGQPATSNPTTGAANPPPATGDTGATGTPQDNSGALAKLSEIPVGGGKVVTGADGKPIVIVQVSTGIVKAYSAACTHQGTTVGDPQNGIMTCPNHGSQFKAADGSVAKGPAASPLPEVKVATQGDNIILV